MISSLLPFETARVELDKNVLLHSAPAGVPLEHVKAMKMVTRLGKDLPEGKGASLNMERVEEEEIEWVHRQFGEHGLLQLLSLAMGHDAREFEHFWGLSKDELRLGNLVDEGKKRSISYDNAILPADERLNAFNTQVLNPSLSRKLYRAGRHHGSLVYGLGGPRILVSHPFQGIERDIYDVYANSIDVVTSLSLRGYRGSFHFLDYVGGLDREMAGFPSWAIWFSVIAAHSDLVIFVKEHEGEFGPAQKLEMAVTPDRVRKKIVEIPHQELKWAKKPALKAGQDEIHLTDQGRVSKAEWEEMEAAHAKPFIEGYVEGGFPTDRIIVLRDERVDEYPLDFPIYDAAADLGSGTSRFLDGRVGRVVGFPVDSGQRKAWWQFWKRDRKG